MSQRPALSLLRSSSSTWPFQTHVTLIMIQHPMTLTGSDRAGWASASSRAFQGGPGAQLGNTYIRTKSQTQRPDGSGLFSLLHNSEKKKKIIIKLN